MNQTLAAANHNQNRNANPKLFAAGGGGFLVADNFKSRADAWDWIDCNCHREVIGGEVFDAANPN